MGSTVLFFPVVPDSHVPAPILSHSLGSTVSKASLNSSLPGEICGALGEGLRTFRGNHHVSLPPFGFSPDPTALRY